MSYAKRIFLFSNILLGLSSIVACGNDKSCTPDTSYHPTIKPAEFTTLVDNPLLPLPVGAVWKLESTEEKITITVNDNTYTTANGVECVEVHDQARSKDDQVIEDTRDWFAQDAAGNVWYMGEDTRG